MEPFNIFLDEKNVWKLDEHKKIQLVYALQSLYVENATSEFLEASKENTQVKQQLIVIKAARPYRLGYKNGSYTYTTFPSLKSREVSHFRLT